MTRLTLQPRYFDRPIHVGNEIEAGEVVLTLDIERHETFCSSPVTTTFTPSGEGGVVDQLAECTAEIRRLQDEIERQTGSISRTLTPDEARALAAALIHFADEEA